MSIMDLVVSAIIASLIVAATWYLLRNKRKRGICAGCSSCPFVEGCMSKKDENGNRVPTRSISD